MAKETFIQWEHLMGSPRGEELGAVFIQISVESSQCAWRPFLCQDLGVTADAVKGLLLSLGPTSSRPLVLTSASLCRHVLFLC